MFFTFLTSTTVSTYSRPTLYNINDLQQTHQLSVSQLDSNNSELMRASMPTFLTNKKTLNRGEALQNMYR